MRILLSIETTKWFFLGKNEFPVSEIAPFNISNTILWEKQYLLNLNQIFKNKASKLLWKKEKLSS